VRGNVLKLIGFMFIVIFALSAIGAAYAIGVVTTITMESPYTQLAYDSGKSEIFAASGKTDTVSVISDVDNTVVANVNVEEVPYGLAYDNGTGEVFVADANWSLISVISDSGPVPEFQPFILLPLFMVTTLVGAIILRNKRNAKMTAGRPRGNRQ